MGTLRNLKGTSVEEIECEFITKPSEIKDILENGKACTAADSNGAINIWKDDNGLIRCESMAYFRSLDTKEFENIEDVEKWTKKWLRKIK